jgi:hypothetical protein
MSLFFLCSMIWGEKWLFVLLRLVESLIITVHTCDRVAILQLEICKFLAGDLITMTQFTCKGVKQINNRISFKHLYHSYLSVFFISAGVPNGEFPEILIAKCRSWFYCTWFFSRAEYFESWRKGPSNSGEKCSRRKVHMYDC